MILSGQLLEALTRLSMFGQRLSAKGDAAAASLTADDLDRIAGHLGRLAMVDGPSIAPLPPEPADDDGTRAAAFDHLRRFADIARSADPAGYAPMTLRDLDLLCRAETEPVVYEPPVVFDQ